MFEGPSAEACASASEDCCAGSAASGLAPPPAGFAEMAEGKTLVVLTAHYRVSHHTITRWRQAVGLSTRPGTPPPADFTAKAEVMGNPALAKLYGVSVAVAMRWRRQLGLPAFSAVRQMPENFATTAGRHTVAQHALFHSVSHETARKWCQAVGVAPKASVSQLPKAKPAATPAVAGDAAAQAAHHLRRHFASVFRADVLPIEERKHLPANGKNMFVVAGKGALPATEVIALAENYGFDPRAWARI